MYGVHGQTGYYGQRPTMDHMRWTRLIKGLQQLPPGQELKAVYKQALKHF